jgi:hypothetical protein
MSSPQIPQGTIDFYERMNQMNRDKQLQEEAIMKANNRKFTVKPGSADSYRIGAKFEGVPLGGRHKSRRHKRMRKSRKSRKSRRRH